MVKQFIVSCQTMGSQQTAVCCRWCVWCTKVAGSLEDSVGFTHSALDVQRSHVLPSLLQQGDQEVDGELNVDNL
jgi:hypothetical protein